MAKSRLESNLLEYLHNEVITTQGFIERVTESMNRINDWLNEPPTNYAKDSKTFSEQVEILNEKTKLLENYRFRLMWLEGQVYNIEELNK